jgi:predicted Zn-ribbon and HTH transcriptional regulator
MAEIDKKVKFFKCNNCGHEWQPRSDEKPLICPKCKSARWDLEPKKKNSSKK